MYQFYFLSILLNLLMGLMLTFDSEETALGQVLDTRENILHLVTGVLSVFIAFVKIFVPAGNGCPFFGDLIPVAAGFAGGAAVLIQYVSEQSENITIPAFLSDFFTGNKKIIGIVCFIAAVLHFILPGVVLF